MTTTVAQRPTPQSSPVPPRRRAEDADPKSIKAEVMRLMQDFSIEATPGELARLKTLPADLPPGSRVYIPWVPGNRLEQTVEAAIHLKALGMTPVPHIAARSVPDVAALDTLLASLRKEAGVQQVMLIAGSKPVPAGSLDSSLQVLNSGLLKRHQFTGLSLAAHPEGSPDISAKALVAALQVKNAFARTSSAQVRLVTQFCFAGEPVVAWERAARIAGNRLPVHVGLAGLASLPRLLRYGQRCGVGASMQLLTGQGLRQGFRLLRVAARMDPGNIIVAVARARLQDPGSLFERFHFFPFGALDPTVAWAAAAARGQFTLEDGSDGLTVT